MTFKSRLLFLLSLILAQLPLSADSDHADIADPRFEVPRQAANVPSIKLKSNGDPQNSFQETHVRFVEAAKKKVSVTFFGDSITEGWNKHLDLLSDFGEVNNFGIGGDRIQNILWRIQNGELPRSGTVIIQAGTNNILVNSPEEIADGIIAIIKSLQNGGSDLNIIVFGIFPRKDAPGYPLMNMVKGANLSIALSCAKAGVKFVDIGSSFLGSDGNVPKDIMPDGLHLGRRGYEIWSEELKELVGEPN